MVNPAPSIVRFVVTLLNVAVRVKEDPKVLVPPEAIAVFKSAVLLIVIEKREEIVKQKNPQIDKYPNLIMITFSFFLGLTFLFI
jgi:hypothetical protein